MENLELQKFDKGKAELTKLANSYKNLKIEDINDDFGYEQVKRAKDDLVKERGLLERLGKSMRDNFTKVNREIMKKQKDIIGIVEPVELELKSKLKAIDDEKIKLQRMNYLEDKKNSLKEIDLELLDDEILSYSDGEFITFFNEKKTEYLEAKQQKIDDTEKKIQEDKDRKEFEKQAKIDADKRAKRDLEDEKQNEKEADEMEKIKLKAKKEFQEFLKDNGYTNENKDEFYLKREDNKVILYKKVNEFINK